MVRAPEIAAGLPRVAGRSPAGPGTGAGLCRPRFLGSLEAALAAKANELGFDTCRVADAATDGAQGERLDTWLASGFAGDMEWMGTTADRRRAPQSLWNEVRSVVVLGVNYGPDHDPREDVSDATGANISVYARHRDYHDVIKGRLKQLAGWLAAAAPCDVKVFVDTAPVMEKPLAQRAGLGWQGRHTNLVSREFGSWLFLGTIFTTLALTPDAPESDHCGSCRACLDICPTSAFPAPNVLDARRCISYLTIEHKGTIEPALRPLIGNRVYGCDDCLAVCPWNKYAQVAREAKLQPRADLTMPRLADWLALDDARFRALLAGSPVKRIGVTRFLRNLLIAAGNSGDAALVDPVVARLDDDAPLVRAMAVWALGRLAPARAKALAPSRCAQEPDAAVRDEWTRLGAEEAA